MFFFTKVRTFQSNPFRFSIRPRVVLNDDLKSETGEGVNRMDVVKKTNTQTVLSCRRLLTCYTATTVTAVVSCCVPGRIEFVPRVRRNESRTGLELPGRGCSGCAYTTVLRTERVREQGRRQTRSSGGAKISRIQFNVRGAFALYDTPDDPKLT